MQIPDSALTSCVTLGMPLPLYRHECPKELAVLFNMVATSHMWLMDLLQCGYGNRIFNVNIILITPHCN